VTGPGVVAALLAGGCVVLLVPAGRAPLPAGAAVAGARSAGARPVRVGLGLLAAVAAAAALLPLGLPSRVVVLGLLAAVAVASMSVLVGLRRAAGAAARTGERTRETCEAIADDLAAGASTERALVRAATEWADLHPVLSAHRVGADVPSAWRGVAAAAPGADGLRLVAAAWQVSGRTGQGLALALHRVAADLRAAATTRRAVDSELASARATGRLVAGLPVLAWLMGSGAGQHPLAWLLAGPVGWACLAVGLGLLLLGLTWVELLARGAVSS
jgi:tight adherence protein B